MWRFLATLRGTSRWLHESRCGPVRFNLEFRLCNPLQTRRKVKHPETWGLSVDLTVRLSGRWTFQRTYAQLLCWGNAYDQNSDVELEPTWTFNVSEPPAPLQLPLLPFPFGNRYTSGNVGGWVAWSDASPFGKLWEIIWEIPNGSGESTSSWQLCYHVLRYFYQPSSVYPNFGLDNTTIYVFSGSDCCIFYFIFILFYFIFFVWSIDASPNFLYKQRCIYLNRRRAPILYHHHQHSRIINNRMLDINVHFHDLPSRTSILPQKRSFIIRLGQTSWDIPIRLPSGIAAGLASVLSFGVVIPCMNQV